MAIAGFVVSAATGKVGARYAAMMFMVSGVYASYVVGLAWVSNTLPRPTAKVSDFSSFPLKVWEREREEEEERALVCEMCVLWMEGAGFVVKIFSLMVSLLGDVMEGEKRRWGGRGLFSPQFSSKKNRSILICGVVRYIACRGSGTHQRHFKLVLHLRLLHVSPIGESEIR